MPSPKIRPRVFIAAILLTVISGLAVVIVWNAQSTPSKQNPPPTWTPPIVDYTAPFYTTNFLVETNLNSPQPLVVHVFGGLADSCYRIRYGTVNYHASEIRISLYMGFRYQGAACLAMVVSKTVSIPIDVAALPPGDYTIDVAGQTQTVTITPEMQAIASVFNTEPAGIRIDRIEYIAASEMLNQSAVKIYGRYTIDCPRIIGVVQQTEGHKISFIPKVAGTCENQYLPETMPLEIPLDLTDLPLGEYTLAVGDQSVKFDLDTAPTPLRILPADGVPRITEPPTDPYWLPVN